MLQENEIIESLYSGTDPKKIVVSDEIKSLHERFIDELNLESFSLEEKITNEWYIPKDFMTHSTNEELLEKILNYVLPLCKSSPEEERIIKELELFYKYDCLELVKYLIYLSDIIKNNDIIVGIGRGSSVSLYILFLIGIHKVDSLKFNLDYSEFFKGEKNG